MPSNVSSALAFIVNALTSLYLLVLLLRFWLPWLRADFRNPLAQAILRLTSPAVAPLRRFVPSFGRLDTATILVAFAVQYLALCVVLLIIGVNEVFTAGAIPAIAMSATVKLVLLSVNLFMFAIFVRIILSWISPGNYNPATAIITTLTEPILQPLRRLIPPLGGFDISPIFAIIALGALTRLLAGFNQLGI